MYRLFRFLMFVLALATNQVSAAKGDQDITVWAWPLDEPEPQPLAEVTVHGDDLSCTLNKFFRPQFPYKPDAHVRVGIFNQKTSNWRGILTSASGFDPAYQQKLSFHVNEEGIVYHVGFVAYSAQYLQYLQGDLKGSKAKTIQDSEPVVVEVVKPNHGPTPILNKPVVLSPEGRVQGKEDEKTFLQKYWWAILLFLVLQVAMGGGREDK